MRRIPGFRPLPEISHTTHSIARAIDDEMRFHLQMRVEELMREGRSQRDAEAIAAREYGDRAAARTELAAIDERRAGKLAWREWFASWRQDVRFALRGLRARPVFGLTILITLALGIGANAAIFSVVDALLLRPLPYAKPAELVHLWETFRSNVENRSEASYPDYLDWRVRNHSFADLGGYHGGGFLVGGTQPFMVTGAKSTANFFDLLGVHAVVGRTFLPGEDAVGAPRVALLTYGLWTRQYAGDRAVVGRAITLDGNPATVVGVLPSDFSFARQATAEIWTPIDRGDDARRGRGNHWLNIVARLKPGATLASASADMSSIMRSLAIDYPRSNARREALIVPLQQELVGSVRPILLLLYGAVVVVLLIACVNIANLLLIRGTDRQREIAVRAALGAGKGRLVRQFITESVVLAIVGGALGLVVAKLSVGALTRTLVAHPVRGMPSFANIDIDPRVIIYSLAISIIAGVAFGLLPAFRITRSNSYDVLRGSGRGVIGGAGRLRDWLVVGEIGLTVVLLSGAVLFGRSLVRLLSIDPGLKPEHVVTGVVVLPKSTYTEGPAIVAAFERVSENLRAVPGTEAVGAISKLPLDFGNSLIFDVVGQPKPEPGFEPSASFRGTMGNYFAALGIPLVSGRLFDARDQTNGPMTAIVNRALVKAYFGNVDPIGQRLYGFGDTATIIGVVGDVPIGGIEDKIPPTLYFASSQYVESAMAIAIRTSAGVDETGRALRSAVATVDPAAAVTRINRMTDLISQSPSVFMRRFPLYLLGAFAVTALILAIVGIYGVVSYSVAQRTREMGIRMALGASPSSLLTLVMKHGGWMAGAGIVVGVGGSLLAGRFAGKLLYGVAPSDPTTYLMVAFALAAVAIGATLLPARRATRVDPTVALRAE
ncbi:MAG TPA: ABC transporter permease [Gemmatimonadaceae bacterium]